MPRCINCKGLMAPNFLEDGKCIFCTRLSDEITYEDGGKVYTKKEAIAEYELFLKKLGDLPNVKTIIDEAGKSEMNL